MAKTKTDARDPDEQVSIRLTAEVRFDEWNQTLQPGQELAVRAALLDDPRLAGKFEEV